MPGPIHARPATAGTWRSCPGRRQLRPFLPLPRCPGASSAVPYLTSPHGQRETGPEVMPGESALPTGVQAAAAYLRELLLRPGRYRRTWEQYAERSRAGQVNQLAVAEGLAHYLGQPPAAEGDADVLPRQLKDTTARALSGKLLSKATLALFMDAFELGPPEREQLLKLWEGSARVRVLSGPRAIREDQASML